MERYREDLWMKLIRKKYPSKMVHTMKPPSCVAFQKQEDVSAYQGLRRRDRRKVKAQRTFIAANLFHTMLRW